MRLRHLFVVDQVLPEYDTALSGTKYFQNYLNELFEMPSRSELKFFFLEYQDLFAKYDYDLGNFTAINHSINTGDSLPIKQRIRRSPSKFEGEEENLKKMLDSGVIKPSNSAWASVPVLIRNMVR